MRKDEIQDNMKTEEHLRGKPAADS